MDDLSNSTAWVEVDLGSRRLTIADERASIEVRALPERFGYELITARTERVTAERGRIRFFPEGSSTGGRLTVSNGRESQSVDVDWLTGRVSLGQGAP